jgi:hypothetical protein
LHIVNVKHDLLELDFFFCVVEPSVCRWHEADVIS